MSKIVMSVPGMTCQHCVRAISASVSDVTGVDTVRVDLHGKRIEVSGSADESAVRAAVADVGYEAVSPHAESEDSENWTSDSPTPTASPSPSPLGRDSRPVRQEPAQRAASP